LYLRISGRILAPVQRTHESPPRLGRFELLGAWLRIWTPPRGAVIPPVPWRRLAWSAAVLVAALALVAVLVVPDMARDRAAARERERRAESAHHTAFLTSVDRTQTPHHGRGERDPGAGTPDATRIERRAALVSAASSTIRSHAAATTDKPIRDIACEPAPRTLDAVAPSDDLSRAAAGYDCTAVTATFGSSETGRGLIGIPFRLVVRFSEGTFAWCQIVPLGDRDRLTHPLPPACRQAGANRR
jgi:hypothetical protein